MSLSNIKVKSPVKPKSPIKSPYYIENVKNKVLISLGINLELFNLVNEYNVSGISNSNNYKDYIEKFKNDLNLEIDLLYNIYTTNLENINEITNDLNLYIENINEYLIFTSNFINTINI